MKTSTTILTLVLALSATHILTANLILHDIDLDLTDGEITHHRMMYWSITVPIPSFTLAAGDDYFARVSFTGGNALKLAGMPGDYESVSVMLMSAESSGTWATMSHTGSMDFTGTEGELLRDPYYFDAGYVCGPDVVAPFYNADLTGSSFSFTGFEFHSNIRSYALESGDGVYDRFRVYFGANEVAIIAVPEPGGTFALLALSACCLLVMLIPRRRNT